MKCFGLKDNGPLNNNEKTSLSFLNLNESSKQLEPNSAPILSESPLMKNSSTVPPSNKNVVLHLNKKIESITKKEPKPSNIKKSYTQASKANILMNIKNDLCIKEAFPSLSANEVGKMIKAKNSSEGQRKPRINMTTRVSRSKKMDLIYFIFSFHFYFLFNLLFNFLLLEQLGLGLIGYAVTSVTI